MEHYLILARSVTYAQRMQRVLDRAGIRSRVFRAPRELTDLGCAYVLRVSPRDYDRAIRILHGAALVPVQIFYTQGGAYREVTP